MRKHTENNLYFQLETSKQLISELGVLIRIHFGKKEFRAVKKFYKTIRKVFRGNFSGYRKCNTEYHTFEHTEQVLLAAARIIDGCILAGKKITGKNGQNILFSALLHDIGFIQEDWDTEGTGAKYTNSIVKRGISFVKKNARKIGLPEEDIPSICRIMESVNVRKDFNSIRFVSSEEKMAGMILGTADLLGQMSSRVYLEKLLFLFREFQEGGVEGYETEFDMIKKTIGFYEFTKERLINSYDSIFMDVSKHFKERYGIDNNQYMYAIDKNIQYLMKIINDGSKNFKHKLRRAV